MNNIRKTIKYRVKTDEAEDAAQADKTAREASKAESERDTRETQKQED